MERRRQMYGKGNDSESDDDGDDEVGNAIQSIKIIMVGWDDEASQERKNPSLRRQNAAIWEEVSLP
jgi:hypothetical protein